MDEINAYDAAISTFKDKYNAFPGDFNTATIIWGRADGGADVTQNCTSPDTDTDSANIKATCNGNGNGRIATGGTVAANTEVYRLWQHLSNAELITGKYSGVGGAIGSGGFWRIATVGVNIPGSLLSGGGGGYYVTTSAPSTACSAPLWTGPYIDDMFTAIRAGEQSSTGGLPWAGLASGEDMWKLDSKFDDGKPGTGRFRVNCPQPNCIVGTDTLTSEYIRGDERRTCRLAALLSSE